MHNQLKINRQSRLPTIDRDRKLPASYFSYVKKRTYPHIKTGVEKKCIYLRFNV